MGQLKLTVLVSGVSRVHLSKASRRRLRAPMSDSLAAHRKGSMKFAQPSRRTVFAFHAGPGRSATARFAHLVSKELLSRTCLRSRDVSI